MTRTERAAFPRALQKDRHDTRTGLNSDPKHIQKGGAGAHGWGSLDDEARLEAEAYEDEPGAGLDAAVREPTPGSPRQELDPADVEKAREFRKHALKDGDLGSIARTSAAVSTSPPKVPIQRDADILKSSDTAQNM